MNRRRAFSLLELSVSAAIFGMLLATSLQMLHALSDHQRSAERRAYAQMAIAAVAEEVADFSWEQLTTESANRVQIPGQLATYLPAAKLTVAVEEEAAPKAKRIKIALTWSDLRGRTVEPLRLTTWVYDDESTKL